jgi:hypothetical protein
MATASMMHMPDSGLSCAPDSRIKVSMSNSIVDMPKNHFTIAPGLLIPFAFTHTSHTGTISSGL